MSFVGLSVIVLFYLSDAYQDTVVVPSLPEVIPYKVAELYCAMFAGLTMAMLVIAAVFDQRAAEMDAMAAVALFSSTPSTLMDLLVLPV